MKLLIVICLALISFISAAQYEGSSGSDAAKYIDDSQGVVPYEFSQPAHPRGHAVGTDTGRYSINSVQDFSRLRHRQSGGRHQGKTGFLSREDQNNVVNLALQHQKSQNAIQRLNKGGKRSVVNLGVAELNNLNLMVGEWVNGKKISQGRMRAFTMVLGHFDGSEDDTEAAVHIQTAYPKM